MNAEVSTQEQPSTPKVEAEKPAAPVDAQETAEGQPQKERNPAQPRFDELTRARRQAERERDYWREQAVSKQAQSSAPQPPAKPVPESYKSYDEYVEALTDWKADQKLDTRFKDRDEREAKARAAEKQTQTWRERATAAAKEIPDFDAVLSASDVVLSDAAMAACQDSDLSAKLLYHIAKNAAVADRLNEMSPTAAAREVGRIEAELLRAEKTAKPEPEEEAETIQPDPPKRSKAPAPPTPVGQGRSTQTKLADMSMDEFMKTRAAQGARWAR